MKLTTTLNRIRAAHPCSSGWRTLLEHLGADYDPDAEINLLTILGSNGVQDMLWCLRATKQDSHRTAVQLSIAFAERALPVFEREYPDDDRPWKAIQAARDFLDGKISAAAAADAAARAARAAAAADAAARAARAADTAADAARAAARAAYAAADAARAADAADAVCAAAAAADAADAADAVCAAAAAADAAARAARAADAAEVEAQTEIIRNHLNW